LKNNFNAECKEEEILISSKETKVTLQGGIQKEDRKEKLVEENKRL